eukprot:gnl/TRDRNA2_/TRDRNA2_174483_c0_seq12.p1 gnl/TRDRNA2_/TRDRNA2_174483_c0~~gnl/TRDRNA2_/TRDRNA2_174483_c0_seq12.p1  ORF type:complete len:302 (+),score=21.90 gnl/TRDRNA2_/TRDRNA2_174483_c0_seq12:106-1011(+)
MLKFFHCSILVVAWLHAALAIHMASINRSCLSHSRGDATSGTRKAHIAQKPQFNRTVVVNHFHKSQPNQDADLSWLTLNNFHVERVGLTSPRHVSEAKPWLQWIVDNYDNLPEHIVFLHGDQHSYHSDIRIDHIAASKPVDVEMLSSCVWSYKTWPYLQEHFCHDGSCDLLYNALFGISLEKAWKQWDMAINYRCCSEMAVSRDAVRKVDRSIYKEIVSTIDRRNSPWAWILEYTWQNMFTKPIRPTEDVLATLRSNPLNVRPPVRSMLQTDLHLREFMESHECTSHFHTLDEVDESEKAS